jgi:hypothetical protein
MREINKVPEGKKLPCMGSARCRAASFFFNNEKEVQINRFALQNLVKILEGKSDITVPSDIAVQMVEALDKRIEDKAEEIFASVHSQGGCRAASFFFNNEKEVQINRLALQNLIKILNGKSDIAVPNDIAVQMAEALDKRIEDKVEEIFASVHSQGG